LSARRKAARNDPSGLGTSPVEVCTGSLAGPDNQGKAAVNIHAPKAALAKTNNTPNATMNIMIRCSSPEMAMICTRALERSPRPFNTSDGGIPAGAQIEPVQKTTGFAASRTTQGIAETMPAVRRGLTPHAVAWPLIAACPRRGYSMSRNDGV